MHKAITSITIIAFWLFVGYEFVWDYITASPADNPYTAAFEHEDCTVAGIDLHGTVVTYSGGYEDVTTEAVSEDITAAIKAAQELPNIKGILLDVDSPGGDPIAAEEIVNALTATQKPSVAVIRSRGTSAAYWAATGADTIFASLLSDVGSIGVTYSYVDASEYNEEQGFTFNQLSTGEFKDFGNPEKPLTEAERSRITADLQTMKDIFVETVARERGMTIEEVEGLADGSSWLGEAALIRGLIDHIGGQAEAEKYLEGKIGETVSVCWG